MSGSSPASAIEAEEKAVVFVLRVKQRPARAPKLRLNGQDVLVIGVVGVVMEDIGVVAAALLEGLGAGVALPLPRKGLLHRAADGRHVQGQQR